MIGRRRPLRDARLGRPLPPRRVLRSGSRSIWRSLRPVPQRRDAPFWPRFELGFDLGVAIGVGAAIGFTIGLALGSERPGVMLGICGAFLIGSGVGVGFCIGFAIGRGFAAGPL